MGPAFDHGMVMVDPRRDDKPEALRSLLDAALARRAHLLADPETDVFRLVHGFGDGLAGLNIDIAGPCAVIWTRRSAPELAPVVAWLMEAVAPEAVLHKGGGDSAGGQLLGGQLADGELLVREAGLRYALEPMAAQNLGLFIDARPMRAWLRDHSEGAVILNTFAYTGSLGVAARAGGARSVVQVDQQKAQLLRARHNHELNGQVVDDRDFMRADVFRWLRRSKRQVGGLILDPPPRLPGRRRGDPQAWSELVRHGAPLIQPGGWMLALLNRRGRPQAAWEEEVQAWAAAAGAPVEPIWRGTSGDDFFEPDPEQRLRATAFRRIDG